MSGHAPEPGRRTGGNRRLELWHAAPSQFVELVADVLVVSHGRYVTFQMAEVAVPRQMFQEILSLIARLRAPPAPA